MTTLSVSTTMPPYSSILFIVWVRCKFASNIRETIWPLKRWRIFCKPWLLGWESIFLLEFKTCPKTEEQVSQMPWVILSLDGWWWWWVNEKPKEFATSLCTWCNGWCWGVFLNYLSTGHPSEVLTCTLGDATPASKATQSVTKLPFPILMQLILCDACFSDIYHETQILTGLMHCKKTQDLQWGRVLL